MNLGPQSYKSEVAKTEQYKKANGFQQDLLYLNDLCENSFPEIDSVFPHQLRESIVDSLMNLLSNNEINKQIFRGYARYYLSHFDKGDSCITTHSVPSENIKKALCLQMPCFSLKVFNPSMYIIHDK